MQKELYVRQCKMNGTLSLRCANQVVLRIRKYQELLLLLNFKQYEDIVCIELHVCRCMHVGMSVCDQSCETLLL